MVDFYANAALAALLRDRIFPNTILVAQSSMPRSFSLLVPGCGRWVNGYSANR
jgi:hypothetical protein